MKTQKKLYLLPNRCQLIGWILVGVSLVFAVGSLLFIKGDDQQVTYAGMGIIFSFIGLFLAGLSREKQEDEFTVFLRTRSALTAVAFMFALKVGIALFVAIMATLRVHDLIPKEAFDNRTMAMGLRLLREWTGYGGAFILYLLLYKIRLARYNREVADEE